MKKKHIYFLEKKIDELFDFILYLDEKDVYLITLIKFQNYCKYSSYFFFFIIFQKKN